MKEKENVNSNISNNWVNKLDGNNIVTKNTEIKTISAPENPLKNFEK